MQRRCALLLLVALAWTGCKKSPAPADDAIDTVPQPNAARLKSEDIPRLIILGFDGVDPRWVQRYIDQGLLPNLKALGDKGHRGSLATTNPPQSPVAWAAFATGMEAGRHGIFDFIARNPKNYLPSVATQKIHHAEVMGDEATPARAENLRREEAFWDVIAAAGHRVRTLFVPYSYPPKTGASTSIAGLGTPDARGINSSFTTLTANAAKASSPQPAGGQWALLERVGDGRWRGKVAGPVLRRAGARLETHFDVDVEAIQGGLRISVGQISHDLKTGATSPYVKLTFEPTSPLAVHAATRFTVRATGKTPEIYVEPLSVLPEKPYFPLSAPAAFAQQLWENIGPFKTVGWVHDTSALGAEAMDEAQFLREAHATMAWREKALLAAMEEQDALLIAVFTAPDRIGHMFYRHIDEKHPGKPRGEEPQHGDALKNAYLAMDRIVGAVQAKLRPNDTLLIMSDHGFGSFRRGFHFNRFLVQKGFMHLKPGVQKPRDFLQDVDWSRTKAYAYGTGGIFFNLEGREGQGIVKPSESRTIAKQLSDALYTLHDGNRRVVAEVKLGDDVYKGRERGQAPELRVSLVEGYRASWATTLGGIPEGLFEDNMRRWSGDHASARPNDVPGILLSNRAITSEKPRIEDLAATAYAFTGVKPPPFTVGDKLFP